MTEEPSSELRPVPRAGALMGALVHVLGFDVRPAMGGRWIAKLRSKTAKRWFAGHRVKSAERAEILHAFAGAVFKAGFVPEVQDGQALLSNELAKRVARWDRARSLSSRPVAIAQWRNDIELLLRMAVVELAVLDGFWSVPATGVLGVASPEEPASSYFKRLVERSGTTRDQFAKACGVARSSLDEHLDGKRRPGLARLKKYAETLAPFLHVRPTQVEQALVRRFAIDAFRRAIEGELGPAVVDCERPLKADVV